MPKNFDINNFVIDRILRGVMVSNTDSSVMWSVNQITDPTLNVTTDKAEAVDALSTPIATFNRGKKAEFSAKNSIFDLGLLAAQNGTEKRIASGDHTIVQTTFETIVVPASPQSTPVTLKQKPIAAPKFIYELNGDGTLGKALTYNESPNTGKFTFDTSKNQLTFPTDAVVGKEYFVQYDYESKSGVNVEGDAINFPKAGKFILEILGADVCDQSTLIHAYLVFPNAKLDAEVDITWATDMNHPFKLIAQQDYCDKQKRLYMINVPDEE